MGQEPVAMSAREFDRLEVVRRILERSLTQRKAAELLGLCERQVRGLVIAFEERGPAGLASGKRGRPSNRQLPPELKAKAIWLVRERYADFGPKLAHEKLLELHQVQISRETVRRWLSEAGIW